MHRNRLSALHFLIDPRFTGHTPKLSFPLVTLPYPGVDCTKRGTGSAGPGLSHRYTHWQVHDCLRWVSLFFSLLFFKILFLTLYRTVIMRQSGQCHHFLTTEITIY